MKSTYDAVCERWLDEPEDFWAEAAEACLVSIKKWDRVLDASQAPLYRWFAGGVLNSCYNALDVHIERGRADQPTLIYDSPSLQLSRRSPIVNCWMRWAALCRSPRRSRGSERRPRYYLHANGAGGRQSHAGLRTDRGDPLGRLRRLCRQRTGDPH